MARQSFRGRLGGIHVYSWGSEHTQTLHCEHGDGFVLCQELGSGIQQTWEDPGMEQAMSRAFRNHAVTHLLRESIRLAALKSSAVVQTLSPSALICAGIFQEHFFKALS